MSLARRRTTKIFSWFIPINSLETSAVINLHHDLFVDAMFEITEDLLGPCLHSVVYIDPSHFNLLFR
jgi:hypothetical protein